MSKTLKYVLIAVGALVALLLLIPLFINANSFRPTIEQQLSTSLGRKVQVGNLGFSLFSGSLSADDFSIADDPRFSNKPFLTAKSFKVGVEVWPLVTSKTLNVTSLTIEKPELNLVRNKEGQWNFASLASSSSSGGASGSTAAAPPWQIAKLELKDGRATINSPGALAPSVYDNVNLEASNVSLRTRWPAALSADLPGGGKFNLDGKIGPLASPDASMTPLDGKVTIKGLDLAKSGFVDPGSGISGIVDIANTLVSNGGTAHAQGNVAINKLMLVKGGAPSGVPINADFVIDYALANSSGTIKQGAIKVGKAVANLSGTFAKQGEATILNMKVDGQNLPVNDLEAALPAFGVVLPKGSSLKGGTASANLTVQGPADKATTSGNIGLYNAQLAGFDLNSKMSAISKFTGSHGSTDTTIQKFTSYVKVSPSGIEANSIDAVVPALGSATGAGTVSPAGALNFNMVANISSSGAVGGAMGSIPGLKNTGGSGGPMKIPFAIQGTTSDPKFIPNTTAIATSAIQGVAQSQLKGALPPQATSALGGLLGGKKKK
jgi:AsmA protein